MTSQIPNTDHELHASKFWREKNNAAYIKKMLFLGGEGRGGKVLTKPFYT